jgi:hypothetical protein
MVWHLTSCLDWTQLKQGRRPGVCPTVIYEYACRCLESEQQLQQAMLGAQQAIERHAAANLEAEEAR